MRALSGRLTMPVIFLDWNQYKKYFLRFALRELPWSDPNRLPSYEHRLALLNMPYIFYLQLIEFQGRLPEYYG